jgi:hypothetical protein
MLTEFGMTCPTCLPGLREREDALYKELMAEDVMSMPAFLDVDAFERFILKFSLHYLVKLGDEHILHLRKKNPILLRPRMMSLYLKERVTNVMPLYYVSAMDAEGRDKMFHGGTYEFKKAVPSEIVIDALKRTGLVKEGEGDAL